MEHDGPVVTWRQRLSFDEDELARVEEHARILERAKADAERAMTAARMHFEILGNQVDEIYERRDTLRASTTQLRAQLATRAFRRLPLEILRAVFLDLAERKDPLWSTLGAGMYNHERAKTPFILAAVSRGWRQLALATPQLWSYISVRPANTLRAEGLVTTLLLRSGSSPVDILLPWAQSDTAPWTKQAGEGRLLDIVGAHTSRWRKFEFHLPSAALDVQVLGILRRPTPLLEEFVIASGDNSQGLAQVTFPHFLPFAPRLRYFSSRDCNVCFSPGAAPLKQMQYLRLFAAISCRTLWETLRMVPDLQHMTLRLHEPLPDRAFRLTSRLDFPQLRTLSLFRETCATFAANVHQLSFPVLGTVCAHTDYAPEMAELLQNVNRTLVRLSLDFGRVDARHVDALSTLGCLHTLVFRHCVVSSAFLDTLSEERSGVWVLPRLEYIELSGDSKLEPETPNSLARVIRARHIAHSRGLPGSPQKIRSVTFNKSTVPAWTSEQVALVLEELR